MKLEDLPETPTPAVLEGGHLLYVCREGWSSNPRWCLRPWDDNTRPRDVAHLLEYPARPRGWYHVASRETSREWVLWWDGAAWRFRNGSALYGIELEDDMTISSITINDKENDND